MSQFPPPIPYADNNEQSAYANDLSHLNILAICHWIWRGLIIFFSCIFLIYLALGIMFLTGNFPQSSGRVQGTPPEFMGWFFLIMGIIGPILGWTLGGLTVYSGFCLKKRKRKTLTFVIAGINCISIPIGTTLGVFTFIVLARPSMKTLYNE